MYLIAFSILVRQQTSDLSDYRTGKEGKVASLLVICIGGYHLSSLWIYGSHCQVILHLFSGEDDANIILETLFKYSVRLFPHHLLFFGVFITRIILNLEYMLHTKIKFDIIKEYILHKM